MATKSRDLDITSRDLDDTRASDAKTTDEVLRESRQQRKHKRSQRLQDPSLTRDILGWVAILGSVAWLLILISYDPNDPSAFNKTPIIKPDNLFGKVGANVAAYCYHFVGFGSFIFPIFLILMGILFIRPQQINDWFFKALGALISVFAILTFLGGFDPVAIKTEETLPGGYLGIVLWRFSTHYLNAFGTYLFLFGAVVLSALIATQLTLGHLGRSLLFALRWLGRQCLLAFQNLNQRRVQRAHEAGQQRIIERELDRLDNRDEAKGDSLDKVLARDELSLDHHAITMDLDEYPPLNDDESTQTFAVADKTEPVPTPPATVAKPTPAKAQPPAGGDIRVNPIKREPRPKSDQGNFPFVSDVESEWVYPNVFFFNEPSEDHKIDEKELVQKARALESKFGEFKVTGTMREIHPGPVVTTYEFSPDAGIKYSRVVNLSDDLCLALGAESIRIDRMAGRSSIGLEVPNNKRELITFREMVESDAFKKHKSKLLVALGKTIDGTPHYADLAKMPHLLIAGQTGAGKSVGLNAMVCSILMRSRPDEVKLIMIDPKMVEMGIYADIPHLLTPVVTDPQEASNSLKWAVVEMERRYRILASHNYRNLEQYNQAVRNDKIPVEEDEDPSELLPQIIVVIDEMADLMMVARGEVEESIARLAQKSRAIGIHLILATQRPSVDIITGVIKSNLPSRLSYRVSQKNDSRIILDANGAEQLLGKGDALFLGPGTSRLVRVHAPFLSETEVGDLVKFLKNQGKPNYDHDVLKAGGGADNADEITIGPEGEVRNRPEDPMYDKAARLVVRSGQASVSYMQRKLSLGYTRAAKLMDMMEEDGIVGPNQGSKPRDILVPADYFDQVDGQLR